MTALEKRKNWWISETLMELTFLTKSDPPLRTRKKASNPPKRRTLKTYRVIKILTHSVKACSPRPSIDTTLYDFSIISPQRNTGQTQK